jgi:hypothetical protein
VDLSYGIHRYWTTPPVESREAGSATIHLHRETDHRAFPKFSGVVAEVAYVDATGRYYLRTFDAGGVPTEIIQSLIAEAEELIPYK